MKFRVTTLSRCLRDTRWIISAVWIVAASLSLFGEETVYADTIPHIVLLESFKSKGIQVRTKWFLTQLVEMGYHQDKTMHLTLLKANGDPSRATQLLQETFENQKPDVIAANATLAAKAAQDFLIDKEIPLVFFTVSDPVGAGLISQIGVPSGTNITGIVNTIDRKIKMDMVMRLVEQAVPHLPIRMGMIHSSYPSALDDLQLLQDISKKRKDIVFTSYEIGFRKGEDSIHDMNREMLEVLKELEKNVDFWWPPQGPLGGLETVQLLLEHSEIPVAYGTRLASVKQGALMYIDPSVDGVGREAAIAVDRILKGTPAGKIPVSYPENIKIGVNLKTALKLNIVVPSDILQLAGKNVY